MDKTSEERRTSIAVEFLRRVMRKARIENSHVSDELLGLIADLISAQTGWRVLDEEMAQQLVDNIAEYNYTKNLAGRRAAEAERRESELNDDVSFVDP